MFRYQIIIEYDGTKHSGWQSQKNAKSIQKDIEKTLSKILKTNIVVSGSEELMRCSPKTSLLILIIKN